MCSMVETRLGSEPASVPLFLSAMMGVCMCLCVTCEGKMEDLPYGHVMFDMELLDGDVMMLHDARACYSCLPRNMTASATGELGMR
jgi:hypothetical protein